MWRVVLVVLALCSCAVGKSIFDDDWVDPNPKKTDSTPHPVVTPPVKTPRQPRPVVKPAPDPAPTPDPAPAITPATVPAAEPEKIVPPKLVDPPADAALVDANKAIDEIYKDDLAAAKTPEKKMALSRTLLEVGQKEKDDVTRFALIAKARSLAAETGEFNAAYATIDEIGKTFRVDTLKMGVDLVKSVTKAVHTPQQRKELVAGAGEIVDKAITAGRFEVAAAAAELGMLAAHESGSPTLIKDAAEFDKCAKQAVDEYAQFQKASAILKDKASDPDANLTAGKFLCFVRANWDEGLPLLARSNDLTLKPLATKEAKGAADSDARVELGDGWWDLAKTDKDGLNGRQIQVRAIKWYTEALPQLSGLMKTRVEQRVNSVLAVKDASSPASVASGARPQEIIDAIARHDLIEGMTYREACRSARLPTQLVSNKGNEKTYHWLIKGQVGSHIETERGLRTITRRTVADYGTVGYVEGKFVDDSLVSFHRVSLVRKK